MFNNGFNGSKTVTTAVNDGLGRDDRRTIVGTRWEHDFDNTTTWRNQFVFDDRNINQPTGSTSALGDFPSYNFMSDITKRGELLGMDSTTLVGGWYSTLKTTSGTFNVAPGGDALLGLLQSNQFQSTTNYGVRAREELKLIPSVTAVVEIGWETRLERRQYGLCVSRDQQSVGRFPNHHRGFAAVPKHGARIRGRLQARQ